MFKEILVDVCRIERKVVEVVRTWWKQVEGERRDEENSNAYVMSSYRIEQSREEMKSNEKVGQSVTLPPC